MEQELLLSFDISSPATLLYKKKVIKIVYITLSNKKNPTFDYSEEYRCYEQNIKNCLLHVAAVNQPTNQFAANFMLSNNKGILRINENDQFIGKKINDKEYVYFAVENVSNNKIYSYGFYNSNNDWSKKEQKTFSSKMNTDNVYSDSEWVFKYLSFNELEEK